MDIQNNLFADALTRALQNSGMAFMPQGVDSPDETANLCRLFRPYALLMEVTGYPRYRLEDRMKIQNEVREINPSCKIVMLCDENTDQKLADDVRQAKKDGLIDQFIYGSISSTYLAAVMDAL